MKVKLADGRALRDPVTHTLMVPGEVKDVPDTSLYWRRRLRAGDVEMVDDTPHHRRVPRHEEGAA